MLSGGTPDDAATAVVCNIGPAERRVRIGSGLLGIAAGLAVVVAVPLLSVPN